MALFTPYSGPCRTSVCPSLYPAQVDSLIESAETRQVVNEALPKLPLDYRQVLILKYVEEMAVLEISQIIDRSPKSMEGLLTRSRKALQTQLTGLREG